jgi:hypothetical protein
MAAIGNIPLILHLKAEKINHFHEQLSALSRFWSPIRMLYVCVICTHIDRRAAFPSGHQQTRCILYLYLSPAPCVSLIVMAGRCVMYHVRVDVMRAVLHYKGIYLV